ncbi:hypothetical protein QLL95_gp1285 [Cotonvirus japonicus]|uniref:Membrane protein n=1 Tax=Cotonvirus japonicus TaxID=2811091 RepID=A0ABM7NRP6_9VIRU|nr:hypothetical protein QLL95_gp1285 [Cotonvirus japonicus]BCS82838.1 putative membrane protein [Cotonvirus japonicus]
MGFIRNFIFIFVFIALANQYVSAFPDNLVCPPPSAYPKDFLESVLSAPQAFMGTTLIDGYAMIDIGGFNFVKIANISGTFLQWFDELKKTIVFDMWIDIGGGIQVSVLNSTFSLLNGDKYTRYSEFCMNGDPVSSMPGYVEGLSLNNKFFYTTYYNSPHNGTFDSSFGAVNQSEYFYISDDRKDAVNCLTAFNPNATIKSLTCYNFHKVSDEVIYPVNPKPPCSNKRSDKRSYKRSNDVSPQIITLGKYNVPIDVVYPEYRYLFS